MRALIDRLEPVLLQVVADRRRIAADALADLLEGKALRQKPLKLLFPHLQAFSGVARMDRPGNACKSLRFVPRDARRCAGFVKPD
jgi:hypothetical protein